MIQVICCSSLLSVPGRAGAFSRDFTTSFAPECLAFSGALKLEKLKAPLIPGPEGVVDTNEWCIIAVKYYSILYGRVIVMYMRPTRNRLIISPMCVRASSCVLSKRNRENW